MIPIAITMKPRMPAWGAYSNFIADSIRVPVLSQAIPHSHGLTSKPHVKRGAATMPTAINPADRESSKSMIAKDRPVSNQDVPHNQPLKSNAHVRIGLTMIPMTNITNTQGPLPATGCTCRQTKVSPRHLLGRGHADEHVPSQTNGHERPPLFGMAQHSRFGRDSRLRGNDGVGSKSGSVWLPSQDSNLN